MSKLLSALVVGLLATAARSNIHRSHSGDSDNLPLAQEIKGQLEHLADAKISIARVYKSAYGEEFGDVYKVVGPVLTHLCPLLESFVEQLVIFGAPSWAEERLLAYIKSPACERQIVHRKFNQATGKISSLISGVRNSGAARLTALGEEIKILEAQIEEFREKYEYLEEKLRAHKKATESIVALVGIWQRSSPASPVEPLANFDAHRDKVTGIFKEMYETNLFPISTLTRHLNSITGIDHKSRPRLFLELCQIGYDAYIAHALKDMAHKTTAIRGRMERLEESIEEKDREMTKIQRALEEY